MTTIIVIFSNCLLFSLLAVDVQPQEVTNKVLVKSLHVTSYISYRFATTQVTSTLTNDALVAKEIRYEVQLPDSAFISNFSMLIEEKVYPGIVKEKAEAKKDYEKAKSRGESAGHVTSESRTANKFRVSVNVASRQEVTFNLTYQELLKRRLGYYEHVIYIDPGQTVPDMRVEVFMLESREITSLLVPPIRSDLLTSTSTEVNMDLVVIERFTTNSAYIKFSPTEAQQASKRKEGLQGQFVVRYDVERHASRIGEILVINGYFVHFVAPKDLTPMPRDVMFVIDVSGSMGGTKIKQVKEAMVKILGDLHEGDRFNMAFFESTVEFWHKEFVSVSGETMSDALNKVEAMVSGGGTNMYDGILGGIQRFVDYGNRKRAAILLFLTDGQPSQGITSFDQIVSDSARKNEGRVALFGLAFGAGADYKLIKAVAAKNNGMSRKIYEESDAALQLSGFYDEISTPLLSNVSVTYVGDSVDQLSVTQKLFYNYYKGSELVIAGKIDSPNVVNINIKLSANDADGYQLASELVSPSLILTQQQLDFSEDIQLFTRKLWAYLTISQLLDKIDVSDDTVEKSRLTKRALDLSLEYNFVTSLTSMVVTKPDTDKGEVANEGAAFDESREDMSMRGYGDGHMTACPSLRIVLSLLLCCALILCVD